MGRALHVAFGYGVGRNVVLLYRWLAAYSPRERESR